MTSNTPSLKQAATYIGMNAAAGTAMVVAASTALTGLQKVGLFPQAYIQVEAPPVTIEACEAPFIPALDATDEYGPTLGGQQ